MAIKTKSIFEPIQKEDGIRILVTRYYARGIKQNHFDYWLRELSPSATILFGYKHGKLTWDDFKNALLQELKKNIDSLEAIYSLNDEIARRDITLLCYEKAGNPCHRHIIRDLIESPELLHLDLMSENTDIHK